MLMSTMTGSSWSAAGTAGVACIALAHGHGTNLAPACAGTDLWSHIRSQLWTTLPAVAIAAALFAILGIDLRTGSDTLPQTAVTIMEHLDALFRWNVILLLPIVVLRVMALMKKPVVPPCLSAA